MTKTRFKEDFKRGLGSAIIQLQNSNNRNEYKDIVLWCCLHNTCYDIQCEGNRSSYLYTAICLFEDESYFENAIIEKFEKKTIDTWTFDQLSGLLYHFSADGSETARRALYQKHEYFINLLIHKRISSTRICEEATQIEWLSIWLTLLDGFTAFKDIFNRVSFAFSKSHSQYFIMDWFFTHSERKFGKKRVHTYIEKLKSIEIVLYWQELQNTFRFSENKNSDSPMLQDFIDTCVDQVNKSDQNDKANYSFHSNPSALFFSRKASSEDLIDLAHAVLAEENAELKSNLFRVFRFKAFPLGEKPIFDLIYSDYDDIRETAFKALEYFVSETVHGFAIDLLVHEKEIGKAIRLLCKNYRSDDEAILFSSIKKLPITMNGDWHDAHLAVLTLFEQKSFMPNKDILFYIYRKTLCSCCRYDIVEALYKKKLLSRDILEECLFDSDDRTRKFAEKKIIKSENSQKA